MQRALTGAKAGSRIPHALTMRAISKVLAPTAIDVDRPRNTNTAAVVICHGMGQQVKWETLGQLVDTLERAKALERSFEPCTRQVRFGDGNEEFFLGRAELLLEDRETGRVRHAHVYEAYWAPLTEGRITLRQTIGFLVGAGRSGMGHVFRTFHRYGDFGAHDGPPAEVPSGPITAFRSNKEVLVGFALALLVLLALIVMNAAITLAELRQLLSDFQADDRALLAALTADLWTFELVAGTYLLATFAARRYRAARRAADDAWVVPAFARAGLWTITGALLAATIFIGLVAIPWHYLAPSAHESPEAGLLYWLLRAPADAAQRALGAALPRIGPLAEIDPLQAHAVAVWGLVIYAASRVRGLLVQYVGDVAIYVSSHTVSAFDETRDAIKTLARRVVCAVCEHGGYERIVIVGHSLGSVVAYDALNATMLAEDAAIAGGGPRYHVERVRRLITFGSPLDKTAFIFRSADAGDAPVREGLAATVQPLLVYPPSVGFDWINIHSPHDPISGRLDYYPLVPPANNVVDVQADIPIWAHTQFWSNRALAKTIADSCLDGFTPAPAERKYEIAAGQTV